MLRRKKFYVIYPEYFDAKLPRNKGRKVPLEIASDKPSLKKLVYACKKLNLEFEIEKEKAHPTQWWEQNGRVLIQIDKKDKVPKSKIVEDIANIVRRLVPKKKAIKQKKTKGKYSGKTPPVR